jgi:purine-nucleoside/S-methyl-5'-thioadenosine phosphorylase / adenosine deaminase
VVLTHEPWTSVLGLRHGFLDRTECLGGPPWEAVVARAGSAAAVSVPHQVHGARVVAARRGVRPEADGLVTAEGALVVGVVTADCVPVLIVDRGRRVAAAVHAGWRGQVAGVLEAAVAQLADDFGTVAADLEAAIGPAVAGCCYEVGPEVEVGFQGRTGALTAPAWSEQRGRLHVDLRVTAQLLLGASGVGRVAVLGPCTCCDPSYCSYRRDGAGAGRQLSFVGWA